MLRNKYPALRYELWPVSMRNQLITRKSLLVKPRSNKGGDSRSDRSIVVAVQISVLINLRTFRVGNAREVEGKMSESSIFNMFYLLRRVNPATAEGVEQTQSMCFWPSKVVVEHCSVLFDMSALGTQFIQGFINLS
jgi:hypothetical protein